MELITGIVTWVKLNWDNVIALYLAVVGVASIVVKLTPTIKDNEMLEKIIKFVAKYISLNRTVDDDAVRASSK